MSLTASRTTCADFFTSQIVCITSLRDGDTRQVRGVDRQPRHPQNGVHFSLQLVAHGFAQIEQDGPAQSHGDGDDDNEERGRNADADTDLEAGVDDVHDRSIKNLQFVR